MAKRDVAWWWVLIPVIGAVLYFGGRKVFQSINGEKYRPLFDAAESVNGIPAGLLFRQAYQESRFRDDIITGETVSSAGAVGIMQIIPYWHPDLGTAGALDPARAIAYAGRYLAQLYRQFGTWGKALAAYNWGPGNLSQHPNPSTWPAQTRDYVTSILGDVPGVS
jgi:soluble lytic murein transglycosylase-like protein